MADTVDKVFFLRGQRIFSAVSKALNNLAGGIVQNLRRPPTTLLEPPIGDLDAIMEISQLLRKIRCGQIPTLSTKSAHKGLHGHLPGTGKLPPIPDASVPVPKFGCLSSGVLPGPGVQGSQGALVQRQICLCRSVRNVTNDRYAALFE